MPQLLAAEAAAAEAYRRGAVEYLEWAQLQNEVIGAQREQLQASLDAHRALIELQRLTAASFSNTELNPQDPLR